jgi:hypothetical protein
MDSMQLSASFLGTESYVLAFQAAVLLGRARYTHGLEKIEPRLIKGNDEPRAVMFDGAGAVAHLIESHGRLI